MGPIAIGGLEGPADDLGFRTLATGLQVELLDLGTLRFVVIGRVKEIQGEVGGRDAVVFAATDGKSDDGLEFPEVARPGMRKEMGHGLITDSPERAIVCLSEDTTPVISEQGDILTPLSERGDHESIQIESIAELLEKGS